jgi:hypothetical protein
MLELAFALTLTNLALSTATMSLHPIFRFSVVDTKVIHLPTQVGLAYPELSVSPAR